MENDCLRRILACRVTFIAGDNEPADRSRKQPMLTLTCNGQVLTDWYYVGSHLHWHDDINCRSFAGTCEFANSQWNRWKLTPESRELAHRQSQLAKVFVEEFGFLVAQILGGEYWTVGKKVCNAPLLRPLQTPKPAGESGA